MIITQFYSLAGTQGGMPILQEEGLCSDDQATLGLLRQKECGRIELIPLPRTKGLIAKSLDGQTIPENTLTTPFHTFPNCIQLGKTQFSDFAPTQPIGEFRNRRILRYRRTWIQLET